MLSPARSVYRWAPCGASPRTSAGSTFGTGLLEKVGPRLMLRGHFISAVGMVVVFVWAAAAGNMDLLVLVPAAFGTGQLPVLWALLTGRGRGMA